MSHASLQGEFKTMMTMTSIKTLTTINTAQGADTAKPILRSRYCAKLHTAQSADTAKPILRSRYCAKRQYSALCVRFLLCAVMLISLAACSDQNGQDDPDNPGFEEGIPTEVRITLSSRSGNGTRANGTPKDPVAPVEFIHNWWIAFVDSKKNVTILTRENAQEKVSSITSGSSAANAGGGFEVETFKTIIPSGNYRIYAFANIPVKSAEEIKNWLELDSDNKYKFKSKYISDFVTNPNFGDGVMEWPKGSNIPMTGQMDRQIRNTVEEAFSIEVIRAVAKVDFEFSNPTTDVIVLNKLEIDSITSSEQISIVPNYKAVGLGPNTQLENKTRKSLKFDLNQTLTASGGTHALDFYCKETLPYNDGFDIRLNVTRAGDNKDYEYRTTNIKYINRNDWIHIPIKFNDWIVIWRLHTYPPIGGYPAVYNQSGTGDNLTATVTTGGEFELYPVQIKKNSEDVDFYKDVDWVNQKMEVKVLDGSADLFVKDKSPEVVPNPGNSGTHPITDTNFPYIVMGEFAPDKIGTAKVQITFYLKNKDSNNNDIPYADTKFTCTFTITRQNESYSGS